VLVVLHYLPDLHQRLALPCHATPLATGETNEVKLHCTSKRAEEIMQHAECQLFAYVLLLMKLVDDGDLKNVRLILLFSHQYRPKTSVISSSCA
jgi:hypothetical protein